MNEQLLEPLKFYENTGKALHHENATAYFEHLLQTSRVNVEENRATVKKYNAEKSMADKLAGRLKLCRVLRILLIVLAAIAGVLLPVALFALSGTGAVVTAACAGGAAVISLLVIFLVLNPQIKKITPLLQMHRAREKELLEMARAQVAPLLALFRETDVMRLVEKTLPDMKFDDFFAMVREQELVQQYDFCQFGTAQESTVNLLSGRFAENPFFFCRRKICTMGSHTYHGTLLISWTESYRDSKGNRKTRRRTQTLHASVVKPKPVYHYATCLFYGSQAAPDLIFTREPQDTEELSESQIERKVKKGEERLKDKARDALREGRHFQEMANSEFEVLFGGTDRNHEVQFRLLFTPLAQRNIVELVCDKDAYGDDFAFRKQRRMNLIQSEHAQPWDLSTSPAHYYSHDVDEIRRLFITFQDEFFKKLFFDFAPIFSIPAYMEHAGEPQKVTAPCNFSTFTHEGAANALGSRCFAHPSSATEAILKTEPRGSSGDTDLVEVTAYSYYGVNRVELVSVFGGDGRFHSVPVSYVEYVPVTSSSMMEVAPAVGLRQEEVNGVLFRGVRARCL